jgi:ribosome-binding protein aMBF1 (putative translation factor)
MCAGIQEERLIMATKLKDYVKQYEAGLSPEEREQFDAFREHYDLANQVIELRKQLGLSQSALAERSGIDQADISRIERGVGNPTWNTVRALTRALGVRIKLEDDSPKTPAAGAR